MTSLHKLDLLRALKEKADSTYIADPLTDTFNGGITLMMELAERGLRDERIRSELATFSSRRARNMAKDQWRSLHQTAYNFAEALEHFVALVIEWNAAVKEELVEDAPIEALEQSLPHAGLVKEEGSSGEDLFAEALRYHGFASGSTPTEAAVKTPGVSPIKSEEIDDQCTVIIRALPEEVGEAEDHDEVLFHDDLIKIEEGIEEGAELLEPGLPSTSTKSSERARAAPTASKRQKLSATSVRLPKKSLSERKIAEDGPTEEFSCDQCSERFDSEMLRTVHVYASHKEKVPKKRKKGEKEVLAHPCGVCTKTFTDKSRLKEHQATHIYKVLGDRPHKCDQCTRTFGTPSILKHHQRTKHGVKPHECEECKERFAFQEELRNHRIGKHHRF